MSELLQNWLNNDVGLSTNVSNFEKDFASGYLFGEILHKFRQQGDFDAFRNKNTYEAKISNFKRLEPTFKALGIKFNATQSNAMMNGERGAALRLLYQLKMASERLLLASDAQGAQAKGGTQGQAVPANAGVTKGIRVPREQFDSHERRFFEHRLRATCLNVKQARMDKVTRKFDQEKQKQEIVAYELDNLEQARIAEQREIHRFSMRERLWQNRGAKDEWNAMSAEMWRQNMRAKSLRESQDVSFEGTVVRKQQEKLGRTQAAAAAEVREGVEAFEDSLAGLGFARPRPEGDSGSDAESDRSELRGERLLAATTQAASARELVEALQARMPHAQELEQEAGLFLRKIKESKRAGSIARKERERRRRRVLVEQQREQELLEESKLEEVLLEKLGRESVEEKVISYSVWKTQQYEDVIVRNRQLRQQGYGARRKEDQREAVHRDQDLLQEMLEAMGEQQARERVHYRAVERTRRAQQRAQLVQECEGILGLISEMAFASLEQEQLADSSEMDDTLWREWMSLFVENLPVTVPSTLADSVATKYPLTAVPSEPDLSDSPAAVLDDAALREYIAIRGQWEIREPPSDGAGGESAGAHASGSAASFNPAEELQKVIDEQEPQLTFTHRLNRTLDLVDGRPVNYRLGAIVAALLDRAYAQDPLAEPPPMPDVPLKLVLTGKPFAGKRTLAARLAETYNLHVIDVDEVVRECLTLSKRPDLPTTRPVDIMSFTADLMDEHCRKCEEEGNPYVRQLQGIGYEMQQRLDQGEAIDDEMYVEMLTAKLRSLLLDRIATQTRAVDDATGGAPAVSDAGGGAAATAEGSMGLISEAHPGTPPATAPENADGAHGLASEDAAGDAAAHAAAEDTSAQQAPDVGALDASLAVSADAQSKLDLHIEPSGWIITGFPEDKQRFALFERFLSGWVEPSARPALEAESRKAEAAILAPRPPEDPPPFELTPGGYDLHIRLDVDGDEVVRRAVGRRLDPATSLSYHLEDHPPTSKHQVIFERLMPVDELPSSMGSLTQRIHRFDVCQPEMDFFLSYFGPFPDFHRLVCIDANRTMEEVYDSLDEQAAMLLQRKRAHRAREAAEAEAARAADATAAGTEGAEAAGAEEPAPQAPPPEPERAPSRSKSATPSKDVAAAAPAAPPEDPAPVLLTEIPGYVEKLEGAVSQILLQEWQDLHTSFIGSVRKLFCWHRAHLADFQSGLHGIHQRFIEYLQRPDDKQSLVDKFVMRFNSFSEEYPEMRKQDLTKDELHQRADDLQEELREHVERSRAGNLEQLRAVEGSHWVESQAEVLAAQVQHAVRLEARRYHGACQLLSDFYHGAMGAALPPPRDAPPRIDALGQEEDSAPPAAAAAPDPKKGKAKAKGGREEEPKLEAGHHQGPQRLRRYVEAVADPETGEVLTPGRWEFPFLDALMAQAQVVLWTLAEYSPVVPSERAESELPKAKAKGRASPPPDKKASRADDISLVQVPPTPALYVDLQQALLAERVVYTHRLCVIRNWAERRLLSMSEAAVSAFAQFHDWVMLRHQKELAAVAGLTEIIKEHIESENIILARLTLEGSHLHQHPNVRLRAPTLTLVPPPLEGAAPWRWTVDQLNHLLDVLANAAHALSPGTRALSTQSLTALLARLTQPTGADGGVKEEPQVPPSWQSCDVERLHSLCSCFDHPPCTGKVDCVEFLLHVGLLHSPHGWPSLEILLKVRSFLEPHVPKGASWPDFWITPETLAEIPLFDDAKGQEAAFAAKFRPSMASEPATFDRPGAQLRWIGRVLQAFPAPLRRWQAWELEAAWHDYQVRGLEDVERSTEMFDDMKSLLSESPRPAADAMMPLLTPPPQPDTAAVGSSASEAPRPLPPRPKPPRGLPEPPAGGAINVRQLLACLCLGSSPEDGVMRALTVLGPGTGSGALVAAPDLHAVLVQLGARPLPPPLEGEGRPRHPSFEQLCEDLELGPGAPRTKAALRAADLGGSERVQRILAKTGLARRHCRTELERLFPKRGGGR